MSDAIHHMLGHAQGDLFIKLVNDALSGNTNNQGPLAVVLVGSGNNGKSYLMNAIAQKFQDHVKFAPIHLFKINQFGDIGIPNLPVRMFVVEHDDQVQLHAADIKQSLAIINRRLVVLVANDVPSFLTKAAEAGDNALLKRFEILACINEPKSFGNIDAAMNLITVEATV